MEEYVRLLPDYQQVERADLKVERALFGVLPSYRQSPLQPAWDRILQVGDSSGSQSPLSFGGFGALLRHLERFVQGLDQALQADCLGRLDLALLHPYQPNLAVTWLFQRAMSVGLNQTLPPQQINRLLTAVFQAMANSGDAVLKPFLQDVVQFPALAQTLLKTGITAPGVVAAILPQVGIPALMDWSRHYAGLAGYSLLQASLSPWVAANIQFADPQDRYRWQRRLEAWRYGSGADYGP
jgi:lycopene cyclase CruP